MKHSETTYLTLHKDEKEAVQRAKEAEYSDPNRITDGAYIRQLARERLAEIEGDDE